MESTSPSSTTIDDRVPRQFAVRGALSVPGVLSHSSGINRFTGRSLPRADLRWDACHRSVSVDIQIAVAWPSPVVDVAKTVRETVAQWITDATGIAVSTVNVSVGAVVPAARVTTTDLADAPRSPELEPVVATPLAATSPTVERAVSGAAHPVTRERGPLTPVRAGRPQRPDHVATPPAPELDEVRTAPRTPLTMIDVTHPPVVEPEAPTPRPVMHDIPTPPGPRLENIPTPQGLPVQAVPTPQGLPVTVFPQTQRHAVTPVTVNRHPRITPTVGRHRTVDEVAEGAASDNRPDEGKE
ncbi:Asp23/Gls24 family envelope stress response protein [Corynebacterium variabile]|uniref:Asp23/Gls24 family envelope stress response protein n=1 Tax=Corynebacterium variabile TaxID=1727 RepID=UPI003FD4A61D